MMVEPRWVENFRRSGILFVVSGPSGVGKTTVIESILGKVSRLSYSISHTTRGKRPGEKDGRDYFFVDEGQFEKMKKEGRFLESAEVFGNYYGTSREQVENRLEEGMDLVLDIDVQGAAQIQDSSLSPAVFIFLAPPQKEDLLQRVNARGSEDPQQRKLRVEVAERELGQIDQFDYLVINDELDRALEDFQDIVRAERLKVERRPNRSPEKR